MSDEIQKTGTGARGTFKIERPKKESKSRPNLEVLERKAIRGRFYYDHEKKRVVRARPARKVQTHAVHQDTIPPTMSMTGSDRVYESRSALRREYKEMGFVEVGDQAANARPDPKEPSREERLKEIREDTEKAYYDLKYDRVPRSEREQQCKMDEQRKLEDWKRRNWRH